MSYISFFIYFIGLYLYMLVVRTFSVENIKLRVYVAIGWGKFILCFLANCTTFTFIRLRIMYLMSTLNKIFVSLSKDS